MSDSATDTNKATAAQRRKAFAPRAVALAAAAGLVTTPEQTLRPTPSYTTFFGDAASLVVVVCDGEGATNVDKALAYALAYVGRRRLSVILPKGTELPTRQRALGLKEEVDVYTFQAASAAPHKCAALTLDDLTELKELDGLRGGEHTLKEREELVEPIITWANDLEPFLATANRGAYMAWHCLGRQLLTLKRSGSGVELVAGVNYSKPSETQAAPVKLQLSEKITDAQAWEVKEAVLKGIINRYAGDDTNAHLEHQLQAVLGAHPGLLAVPEQLSLRREFPAKRPGGSSAFIDFLYLDDHDVLHIVETKIGHDEFLVLQGLDYWLWANVNRDLLAKEFAVPAISDFHVDYVVADADGTLPDPAGTALSPYTPAQLAALAPQIPWQVTRISGWLRAHPEVQRLGVHEMPGPPHVSSSS